MKTQRLTAKTADQVRALLADNWSVNAIAHHFGISRTTVSDIRDGITWKPEVVADPDTVHELLARFDAYAAEYFDSRDGVNSSTGNREYVKLRNAWWEANDPGGAVWHAGDGEDSKEDKHDAGICGCWDRFNLAREAEERCILRSPTARTDWPPRHGLEARARQQAEYDAAPLGQRGLGHRRAGLSTAGLAADDAAMAEWQRHAKDPEWLRRNQHLDQRLDPPTTDKES